jgi:hypothetical protein
MSPRSLGVLLRHPRPIRPKTLAIARLLPDAHALADPDRAGAKHAPQLARTRQIDALTRAQREVLVVAGKIAIQRTGIAMAQARRRMRPRPGFRAGCLARVGSREPVVRIRPGCCLIRIVPGRANALS